MFRKFWVLYLFATWSTNVVASDLRYLRRYLEVPLDYPVGQPLIYLPGLGYKFGSSSITVLPKSEEHFSLPTSKLFSLNGTALVLTDYLTAVLSGNIDSLECFMELDVESSSEEFPSLALQIHPVKDYQELCEPGLNLCFFGSKEVYYSLPDSFQPGSAFDVLEQTVQQRVCPTSFQVHYTVKNGSDVVNVDPKRGSLILATHLDPERTDYRFRIGCSIKHENRLMEYNMDAYIKVVDVNNHAPYLLPGKSTHFDVDVTDLAVGRPLQEQFNILDKDSPAVNDIRVSLEDDTKEFFKVHVETIFPEAVDGAMLMHAVVTPIKPVIFSGSTYDFKVVFEDHGITSRDQDGKVMFSVCIFNKSEDVLPQSGEQLYASLSKAASLYAQLPNLSFVSRNHRGFQFNLSTVGQADQGSILNITPRTGIIYVANTGALRSSEEDFLEAHISWKTEHRTGNYTVTVNLTANNEGLPSSQCRKYCGIHLKEDSCVSSCGRGATLGSCQWRNSNGNGNLSTNGYATCSPDLLTCPDGKCDELETLHESICPQDCAPSKNLRGQLMPGTYAGIRMGRGTCYCLDSKSCACRRKKAGSPSKTGTEISGMSTESSLEGRARVGVPIPKVEVHMKENTAACGPTCIVGFLAIISGSFLLVSVVFLVRHRMKQVRCLKKQSDCNCNSLSSVVPSHYVREQHTPAAGTNPPAPPGRQDHSTSQQTPNDLPEGDLSAEDVKWEFPREKVLLEHVLGEGEFGRVVKARAWAIRGQPGYTTVAVKMLKENCSISDQEDLLSELNLLKEVNHTNVIRLMGACTRQDGPLLVIVEFAELGCLRTYLRQCRLVNQERMAQLWIVDNPTYINEATQLKQMDLLSFAWQVARGMSYLSDMKVVHRDLATRNILLSRGKVIKISDFGLSRDVYERDSYYRKSKGKVPVKWMAIESLRDNLYTTKSDVWSFGVVLWEIVTLGSSPYPGVPPERLFQILKSGYRMEKPDYCRPEIYDLMCQCWRASPSQRPSFKALAQNLDTFLQDTTEYIDLDLMKNCPYSEGFNNYNFCEETPLTEIPKECCSPNPSTEEDLTYTVQTDEPRQRLLSS